MNSEINTTINTLPPFKYFCSSIGAIPSSYLETMSYDETLIWLCNYLKETVIPTVNNTGNAVTELQNLYLELEDYVNTYFDNLDVQEEINKKLDEMATDGSLYQIIKQYTDPIIEEQNLRISQINNKVNSATSGSPLSASSTSEMTDTTKIYVNTTNGYWYYYDGTEWTSGGVYQATENSTLLSDLSDNFIPSLNLYKKDDVELNVTSGGTTYQRYTLNNPIPDHYYACFSLNLNRNYKGMLIIQYNNNTLISQYRGNQYQDHPVDENCTKIVFMNTNSSETTPYDLMILDMTNKTLDDVTEFIDEYDTLKDTTHLNNIDPSSLKGSTPYNLYNHEKNIYFDGTYQRSDFYNVAGKKFGLYCYNNGLKRLTNSNNSGKYAIVTTYDSSHTVLDSFSNPSGDITISSDAYVMEVAIVNDSTDAYTNIMIIDKDIYSDIDVNSIGFLPYSYFLNAPYYFRNVITEEDIPDLRPYTGKNMLSLGDSFTYLNYYGEKLASITGCIQTPRGVNGGNIGSFVGNQYTPTGGGGTLVQQTFDAELLAPYDIVTVMGGTNNYGRAMPLGTINDSPSVNNTVYGEIKYVIDKILTLKPSIKIIWCTEPYRIDSTSVAPGGYLPNDAGYTMEELADAIINVCNHYGIPVFDFYRNSGWNSYTVKYNNLGALVENIYTYDGLHPKSGSGNGGELLGISFGNFINSI